MTKTRSDPAAVLPVLLTAVLDSLDVALTCYDADDRLVWWNAAAATFFPKVQNTLVAGTLAADRLRAKADAGYGPSRRQVQVQAPALDREEWNLLDGRRMVRQFTRMASGHQIISYVDISHRLLAEDEAMSALNAERERYAVMIEGTRDGLFDLDMIAGTTWYSSHAHEMLGLSNGALNGDRARVIERTHPDDAGLYDQALADAASRGAPVAAGTWRLRHADGGWRWIAAKARIIYAESGVPARVVGSWADVTAQMEAEVRLRASEERYERVIEATSEGIYDRDFASNTVWFSKRAHQMLGLADDSLNGSPDNIVRLIWPADAATHDETLANAARRREPNFSRLLRVRHADGSWRWIASRVRVVYDASGAVARSVGSLSDVTAQRQAEEALRESETLLRDAQRLARIGSWKWTPDGRRFWSDQMYELFPQPRNVLPTPEQFLAMIHPEDLGQVGLSYLTAGNADAPTLSPQSQYRVRWPDGRMLTLAEQAVIERDAAGDVISVTGTVQDVTERVEAEQAIQASEARLSTILDTAMVGFISVDEQGRIVNFNAEAGAIFGYAAAEMFGQKIGVLIPGMDLDAHRRQIQSHAAGAPRPKAMSKWQGANGLHRDGTLLPLMAGISMVKIGDKTTMTVIFRDMSDIQVAANELRRLSEEKQRQMDELARRSFLLQTVMDTVTDGMVVVADDGGAVLWNRGFLKLVAMAQGVGVDTVASPANATMTDLLAQLRFDRENIVALLADVGKERECVLGDGRVLQVQVLRSGKGSSLLWISDITRRREEEVERMALQERLLQSQKNDAIGAIAGTVSHDFNNLLTIILGFATLSKAQLDVLQALPSKLPTTDAHAKRTVDHVLRTADSIAKSLDNIISGAGRGKSIVANLTSFAKMRPSDLAVGDLSQTMDSAARLIGASMPASVTFKTSGIDEAFPVRHDRGKIEQVLLNLCINSAHAIGERAGSITVRMSTVRTDGGRAGAIPSADAGLQRVLIQERSDGMSHLWNGTLLPGDYVRIDVADTGCGMTTEIMRQIFDPFFTTKLHGQGTGLGLLSVSRIVEEHGGAIHVQSRSGEGTVFSIFLPLAEAAVAAADPIAAAPAELPADADDAELNGAASRNLVLVVDDEEHLTELIQLSLERAGYGVEAFSDPHAALGRFRADPEAFAMVITDQTMPKMTGMELAKQISETRIGVPVLLCTGYSAKAIDVQNLPAGVAGLLRKPFTPKGLIDQVRTILDVDL